jgi:hypothetical protein
MVSNNSSVEGCYKGINPNCLVEGVVVGVAKGQEEYDLSVIHREKRYANQRKIRRATHQIEEIE